MTTLIAIYDADRKLGQCDARCYDAKQPHCDCVCRGKNHGRGIQAAAQNTINEAAEWLASQQPPEVADRELYAKLSRDLRRIARKNFLPFEDPNPDTEPAD